MKPHPLNANIYTFFHEASSTAMHIVSCPVTQRAAIIDSALDYDAVSGITSTLSADQIVNDIQNKGLKVDWHLETHVHADHFSAARYLKDKLGGEICVGNKINIVQKNFKHSKQPESFPTDGSQFDRLLADQEALPLGELTIRVLHTPGHTPACVTYIVGEDAFVGDTLFMPDYGTARCDFPGGDAAMLYTSARRILAMPGRVRLHTCHDYRPGGRPAAWVSTVAEQRERNIHIRSGVTGPNFVAMRHARDATLTPPANMELYVPFNAYAGQ
jgi:glyoxylase-like metal-dependent hydrolase (beta-lactamase superfamily II)